MAVLLRFRIVNSGVVNPMLKLFVLSLALSASCAFAVVPGDTAPPWTGHDLVSGDTINFPEQLGGKPAVFIFWATWCPYCKAFMPYATKIHEDYQGLGVQLITFNHKERGEGDPTEYLKSLNANFIAIKDADHIGDLYEIPFIPGLLIVGGDGIVKYRRRSTDLPPGKTVSELWDEEVRAALDQLIEKQ